MWLPQRATKLYPHGITQSGGPTDVHFAFINTVPDQSKSPYCLDIAIESPGVGKSINKFIGITCKGNILDDQRSIEMVLHPEVKLLGSVQMCQ